MCVNNQGAITLTCNLVFESSLVPTSNKAIWRLVTQLVSPNYVSVSSGDMKGYERTCRIDKAVRRFGLCPSYVMEEPEMAVLCRNKKGITLP